MSQSDLIKVNIKNKVCTITLNRPEKLNSFIKPMRREMAAILESLKNRNDVSVCVITGTGRGFCSGGDIKVMEKIIAESDFDMIQEFLVWGRAVLNGIRSLPIPVIAAVNGPAAGAGMNLALVCDIRIASEKATFGQTFINIGLHPDWGGTYFLPRVVGPSRALEMFWTGRVITAQEAKDLGIIEFLVPHEQLYDEVDKLAQQLASKSRMVLGQIKKGVYEGMKQDLDFVLKHEEESQAECIRSEEAKKGMTAFLEERARRKKDN